jgi:hypothetical protein
MGADGPTSARCKEAPRAFKHDIGALQKENVTGNIKSFEHPLR